MSERVAAFEACDLAIDEIEIEIWYAATTAAGGAGGSGLVGTCTVGVGGLLVGEQAQLSAALPVLASAGLVVGTVSIVIERRGAHLDVHAP